MANGYEANSIIYVESSAEYYVLMNEKRQIDENSWKLIEPLQEDFAAESKYKPNDLVVYQNTVLLLKSPFNQLEPASWIKVPEANINQVNGIHSIERRAEQK